MVHGKSVYVTGKIVGPSPVRFEPPVLFAPLPYAIQ